MKLADLKKECQKKLTEVLNKTYINSSVENAESYFSEKIKPIPAKIVDASFLVGNDAEEKFTLPELSTYDCPLNKYNQLKKADSDDIGPSLPRRKKLENVKLSITFIEKSAKPKIGSIIVDNLEDVVNILTVTGDVTSSTGIIGYDINLYRQEVNGHDVIKFGLQQNYATIKK